MELIGYVFEVHNNEQFQKRIEDLINIPQTISKLKKNCIDEAYKYKPEIVIRVLLNEL